VERSGAGCGRCGGCLESAGGPRSGSNLARLWRTGLPASSVLAACWPASSPASGSCRAPAGPPGDSIPASDLVLYAPHRSSARPDPSKHKGSAARGDLGAQPGCAVFIGRRTVVGPRQPANPSVPARPPPDPRQVELAPDGRPTLDSPRPQYSQGFWVPGVRQPQTGCWRGSTRSALASELGDQALERRHRRRLPNRRNPVQPARRPGPHRWQASSPVPGVKSS